MASTFRTDVDSLATAYLKNRVNSQIAPSGASFAPAYTNTVFLQEFSADPFESHPSQIIPLGQIMSGDQLQRIIIDLGKYYAWIARGHYGILTTTATTTRYDFEGWRSFFFNNISPVIQGHHDDVVAKVTAAVNVQTLSGKITLLRIQQMYDAIWNVINNNKDNVEVDLTVCHSSCHVSCHGSRGRR